MGVAEEIGVGEMAKITDPGFGKLRLLLEQRRRQGGQAAGKVRQAVVFKTAFGSQRFQLGEVHVGGEIQLAGIEEGVLNSLVIWNGNKTA